MTRFVEEAYCITLNRRPDRWGRFMDGLPSDWGDLFPNVHRYYAIDGKKVPPPHWWNQGGGAWGCYRSHLRILEDCLNRGVESVLLLEDDALFPEDFTDRARDYIDKIPKDWGMVYFGGQHLRVNDDQPIRVNDLVYRPYNVNRTHAFAVHRRLMAKVYKHLCRNDWYKGFHIDHHLGRLHQQREDPIYCPSEWLVGQAEGDSNISGRRDLPDRYWKDASQIASHKPENALFVAVVGLHSSGSSCLAGVLWHLGFHLGNQLVGYYGNQPGENCGYEAVGLRNICEGAFPFPARTPNWNRGKIYNKLRRWINEKRREASQMGTIAVGKYPQIALMARQLRNICKDNLRVIEIDRPIEESIESLVRRTQGNPTDIAKHQEWISRAKKNLVQSVGSRAITIQYEDLLSDPRTEIGRVCDFLNFAPTDEKLIDNAIQSVKPSLRHINHEEVG